LAVGSRAVEAAPNVFVEVIPPGLSGDLSRDPDILRSQKDLALARLNREVRIASEPFAYEQALAALRERVQDLWDERELVWGNIAEHSEAVNDLRKSLTECQARLARRLEDLIGSNLRERVCNHCGLKGLVAVAIECTSCRQQGWWGWHPKGT
jgi:hypothetical protein